MATPKRARTTSSTPRSKKAAAKPALENDALPQTQSNGYNLEAVRVRAYQLFEQRGRVHGYDIEDWFRAEAEIVNGAQHSA
ncbi:MAG TPA: DUF2934 domain-containing protein [Terriglobales bacterium]|nr:DUF2934 domain-containing protein [Terriglobales bacterium]